MKQLMIILLHSKLEGHSNIAYLRQIERYFQYYETRVHVPNVNGISGRITMCQLFGECFFTVGQNLDRITYIQ